MLRCTSIIIAILVTITSSSISLGQHKVNDNFPKTLNSALKVNSANDKDLKLTKSKLNKPIRDNATAVTKPRSIKNAPVVPGVIATLGDSPQMVDENVRREIEAKVTADLEQKFKAQIDALVQQQAALQAQANRQAMLPRQTQPNQTAPANSAPKPGTSFLLNDQTLSRPAAPTAETNPKPGATVPNNSTQNNPVPSNQGATNQMPAPSLKDAFTQNANQNTPQNAAQATDSEKSILKLKSKPQIVLQTRIIGPESMISKRPDEFEIVIDNKDNSTATEIIVQLKVPEDMTISRLDREAYLDPENRTVSWKINSILPGQSKSIRYQAVSATTGSHDHTVTVGMRNTFQGSIPFATLVNGTEKTYGSSRAEERLQVAERPKLEK